MNDAGIVPMDTRLLVLPDKVEQKTAGGIIIPDKVLEKDQYAATNATVIALGGAVGQGWNPDDVAKLRIGARVAITRYCGFKQPGRDGEEYWIISDKDVHAVLEA